MAKIGKSGRPKFTAEARRKEARENISPQMNAHERRFQKVIASVAMIAKIERDLFLVVPYFPVSGSLACPE